jgi:demethylmenaquinone methyltransferase/2-methoxy-6-polyprenyl-1,4-benzoquinol methylase
MKSERDVRRMFGRIVDRYDLMNKIMTGGQDSRWRRKAVSYARGAGDERALDVATGTGDLSLALATGGFANVVGLDFAPEMIAAANAKSVGRAGVAFVVGDAMRLPFANAMFDTCTVSFGLRNMANYEDALREMARVIRPGGRLVCLELTPFRKPIISHLFNAYFSRVVPLIGRLLSGDAEAYRYLPESVAAFPDALALAAMMRRAGFGRVLIERVGGGTVAIHVAVKPN